MLLARLFRITIILIIFITTYLPITINPRIFAPRTKCINVIDYLVWGERKSPLYVSDIYGDIVNY